MDLIDFWCIVATICVITAIPLVLIGQGLIANNLTNIGVVIVVVTLTFVSSYKKAKYYE
jgi:hypothetical protein